MNTYKVTWLTMEGEDKVSIKIANSSNEAERKVCDEELNVFIVTNIEEIAE